MYQLRFPHEDVSAMTMQQLRGHEGARVRAVYRRVSKETGVTWNGREYDPENFAVGDPVNMALSAAHACLYGVAHCVIVALGCAPGLGFVHTGHERSFVYDIADLYKADLTIPIAFAVAAQDNASGEIGANARRAVRDAISDGRIMERAVRDIRGLLLGNDADKEEQANILHLWDEKNGFVKNAVAYGKDLDEPERLETGYGRIQEDA
jgi:CRISPR-associated protein Cas1